MTLEQMLATPSVVAALVVVAVVVFVVAFLLGRRRGFQDVQDGVDPNDPSLFGAAKNTSLFGPAFPCSPRNASWWPSCPKLWWS